MKLNLLYEAEGGHTCRIQYRKPDDEDWARRNRKTCPVCAAEYDEELDRGFIGDAPTPEEEEELEGMPSAGEFLSKLMARDDPRRLHKPGEFGTGRVSGVKPEDSLTVAALKLWRDRNINVDPRTGIAKPRHVRDKCGYKHTCGSHPSGRPAWNYPMPDPVATRTTGKQRYNFMFKYNPTHTFQWPVSGMMGFEPKPEFEDYVKSKLSCPVCNGTVEGCDNPVAQEYGQPKPFCTEHLMQSPYAREVAGRVADAPDPNVDYRETEARWKKTRAAALRPGDKVSLGKQVGTLLEVDPEMEDRTHRVRWDNPKTEALRITWVDPEKLDLVE